MLTPSQILARALKLPALPTPPVEAPAGAICALMNCGRPIDVGYPVSSITTDATNEFLDTFRNGLQGHVCEECARVFKAANPHGGYSMGRAWFAFEDGTAWDPLIARESAEATGRACWSSLIREVWPARAGQRCVVLLTTDGKKRLWPRAQAGALGPQTSVLYHNTEAKMGAGLIGSGPVRLNWANLVACLDLIEPIYALGFAKAAIGSSLFTAFPVAHALGLRETRRLENDLDAWRGTPEFRAALLVAQKDPGVEAVAARAKKAPSPPATPKPAKQPALSLF